MEKCFIRTLKQLTYLGSILVLVLCSNTSGIIGHTQTEVKEPIVINIETNVNLNRTDFDTSISYLTDPLIWIESAYEHIVIEDLQNPGTYIGQLAESWTISPDGFIYTFNLKHDILYHDSSPFNAFTMKYSFDRMLLINDRYGPAYLLQEYIAGGPALLETKDLNVTQAKSYFSAGGVTVTDEFTLQITLVKEFPGFISLLATYPFAISPYSLITNMPATYTTNQDDDLFGMVSLADEFPNLNDWTKLGLASKHNPAFSGLVPQADHFKASYNAWPSHDMVGTGPYQMVNNTVDEIRFIKYTNWYGNFAKNAPDVVKWTYEPDGEAQDVHFSLGETDIYYVWRMNIDDYLDPTGNPKNESINSYIVPVISLMTMNFNFNENLTDSVTPASDILTTWNLSHIQTANLVRYSNNNSFLASLDNPFTALKFRKAFSLSFDYQYSIEVNLGRFYGTRAEGIIPRGMWGHQDDLIEKGLVPVFDLVKAKHLFQEVGWRGNITLFFNTVSTGREQDCKFLKSAIESLDVGININIVNISWADYIGNMNKIAMNENGWAPDYNDAYNMLFPFYQSNGFFAVRDNYNNSQMDDLLAQLKSEYDLTTRLNLIKQIETLGASDYNCMYIINRNKIFLTHDWISGVESSGSTFPSYWAIRFQFLSKEVNATPNPIITTSTTTTTPNTIPSFEWQALLSFVFISIKVNNKRNYKIHDDKRFD